MQADDRVWLPHLLAGRRVRGGFIHRGDRMRDYAVEIEPSTNGA